MKYILLSITFIVSIFSFAQINGKKESKFFYKDVTADFADFSIYIIDALATEGQAKFKIKIFNKTNDYLLIKPTEFVFISGDRNILSTDKTYIVLPNEEESEVIDFKGQDMLMENFAVDFKGIYKVSAGAKIITIPDFELPANNDEFIAENCSCSLKKSDMDKYKSVVKFDCRYTGDGARIINPVKASLIMPNGVENPNSKRNKPFILEKGESDYFSLVYQEVKDAGNMQNQKTQIKWNDTFRESKAVRINGAKINFEKEKK